MFEALTFAERRALMAKLLGASKSIRYEAGHLTRDPHAVAAEGQAWQQYVDLADDIQAIGDEVLAVDRLLA